MICGYDDDDDDDDAEEGEEAKDSSVVALLRTLFLPVVSDTTRTA